MTGLLLTNRAIWLGDRGRDAGGGARAVQAAAAAARKRRSARAGSEQTADRRGARRSMRRVAPCECGLRAAARIAFGSSCISCDSTPHSVLKSVPFLVLLAFGLLNFIGGARTIDRSFGTEVHPVTGLMLEAMQGSYQFLLIIIVAFYAGDVMWRERDAKLAEVTDAMPVAELGAAAGEAGALFAVVLAFMAVGALAAIVFQLSRGLHEPRDRSLPAQHR